MEECGWPVAHLMIPSTPQHSGWGDPTFPDAVIWPLDLLSAANMLVVLVAEFTVIASSDRSTGKQLKQPTVRLPCCCWNSVIRNKGRPGPAAEKGLEDSASLCSLHCFRRPFAPLLYAEARWVWFLKVPASMWPVCFSFFHYIPSRCRDMSPLL